MGQDNLFNRPTTPYIVSKGLQVSHYRIIDRVGSGGMGEIFLAEDISLGRNVALKFLPVDYALNEEATARFQREAQAVAKLSHPNIITIYEVGEYERRPFIAMEYVEGHSLHQLIHADTLSIDRVVDLGTQMVRGLAHAHQSGIIHRDIKTSNILVDKEGRARILDFGLATVKGSQKITRMGSIMGTIDYMSPEQVRGQEVDFRSDLFSMGVVLYELLAGQTPFQRENEAAILHAILNDAPAPLNRYRPNVPDGLQKIIDRALQKEPSMRYQTASDMLDDLKRAAGAPSSGVRAAVPGRSMIAVLPFENTGSPEQEYFADGVTDEITSRLAKIGGLGVISHSSAQQYKRSQKRVREIGQELGVGYLLQGTIRWDNSSTPPRLRIAVRLIKVDDETYSWAESYDRLLEQIFSLQSEIAEKVAEAMGVAILGTQKRSSTSGMTSNLEAYDYYLRASENFPSMSVEDIRKSLALSRKAVQLDPEFALAQARLALAEMGLYWFADKDRARIIRAKTAIDVAAGLSPDHPEIHLALGQYYYQGFLDYDKALAEFDIVLQYQPSNSYAIAAKGFVLRRQGKWAESAQNLKRAAELDPRSAVIAANLAVTYGFLRQFDDALFHMDRAILLKPDWSDHYNSKSNILLFKTGRQEMAAEAFKEGARRIDPALIVRDYASLDTYIFYLNGDIATAMQNLKVVDGDVCTYLIGKGRLSNMAGQQEVMRAYFDAARVMLEDKLANEPDVPEWHGTLGIVYAYLGDKEKATANAKRSLEIRPVSKDNLEGAMSLENLARIYLLFGDYDQAMDQLEYLLTVPFYLTPETMVQLPEYAPLHNHPRFQKYLQTTGAVRS